MIQAGSPAGLPPVGEVHVWLVDPASCRDDHLMEEYDALLSHQEREQHRRLIFGNDRHRYLVTRALVRTVLSRYADIEAKQWEFATNAYGKPRASNPHPVAARLSFNVSHTIGLVALAVTTDRAVGIDAEDAGRAAPLGVARAYFSSREALSLSALPPGSRTSHFWALWTLKESYVKARGMGLSLPLEQFSFSLDDGHLIGLTSRDETAGVWWFCQWKPSADHLVSLCAARDGLAQPKLVVRRVVPLRDECFVIPAPMRTSAGDPPRLVRSDVDNFTW